VAGEAQYEQSWIGQIMAAILNWNQQQGMTFSMENIRGQREQLETSVSLFSRDASHVLMLTHRRLPWSGSNVQVFTGDFLRAARGGRFDLHYDLRMYETIGKYSLHAMGAASGRGPNYAHDSQATLWLPTANGDPNIFKGEVETMLLDSYGEELTLSLYADATHNTEESGIGGWNDIAFTLSLGLQMEYEDELHTMQGALGIRYQRIEEEPQLHPLSDVRLHMSPDMDTDASDVYAQEAMGTLTSWAFRALSTLPPLLLQTIMEDGSPFW